MKQPQEGLRPAVIAGTAWMVGMRWTMGLIGIVSTAILARLLAPGEFGIVAMAMLVVSFVETWTSFGVESALIQNKHADRHDFDTAWTLRAMQGLVMALCLVLGAPLAATYFHEPRLPHVLWALAGAIVISAMGNIGTVNFRKELRFGMDYFLAVSQKIVQFIVTIGTALLLRSYWALVAGIVSGYLSGFIMSYMLSTYRPRLSLARLRHIWSFSQWSLVASLGYFVQNKTDELLIGKLTSPYHLGLYNVGSEIAQLPGSELMSPLNKALFPALAKLQDEPGRYHAAVMNSMAAINTITIPAGVGLAMVSDTLVPVLLGKQWDNAIPILAGLAFYGVIRIGFECLFPALVARGSVKFVAFLRWLQFIAFLPAVFLFGIDTTLMGAVYAKIVAASVGAVATYLVANKIIGITWQDVMSRLWRPIVSAALMAGVLHFVGPMLPHVVVSLVAQVALGAIVYALAVFLLWRLAGRPRGPETLLLEVFLARWLKKVPGLARWVK